MFQLHYFMVDNCLSFLGEFKNLGDAESAATNFDYIKYQITSDDREGCLIGYRQSIDTDNEHAYIKWRVSPSIRKGGPKRL